MNFDNLEPSCLDSSYALSPEVQQNLAVAAYSLSVAATISYRQVPAVAARVNRFTNLCSSQMREKFGRYIPSSLKKAAQFTGKLLNLSGKVAFKGLCYMNEVLDFHNTGGTKDPLALIDKSRGRLRAHDAKFSVSCEWMANQAGRVYLNNVGIFQEDIELFLKDYISKNGADWLSQGIDWLVDFNQDLIEQTIRANVLHLLANLADQAYASKIPFADGKSNPFGRILAVIGNCLASYEERLSEIEKMQESEREQHYQQLFKELSTDLLSKCFPRGAEDIQLFHHVFPVTLLKDILWKLINEKLPACLRTLYDETRPLSHTQKGWKKQFDLRSGGVQSSQLSKLPSAILEQMIRKNQGRWLDAQVSVFENWLKKQNTPGSAHLSQVLIKHTRELLCTKDPAVKKLGSFVERYFMEQMMFRSMQGALTTMPLPVYIIQKWIKGAPFQFLKENLAGKNPSNESCVGAMEEVLSTFGLDQYETFPLPPSVKPLVWRSIQEYLADFYDLIAAKTPEWRVLNEKEANQQELDTDLQGFSVSSHLPPLTRLCIDWTIQTLKENPVLMGQQANKFFTLSQKQTEDLNGQWSSIVENVLSLDELKEFAQECLEAFVVRLWSDLHHHYKNAIEQQEMQRLFAEKEEEIEKVPNSFILWFVQEIVEASKVFSLETMSEEEIAIFTQAIRLKKAICQEKNEKIKSENQKEFAALWIILEPKFQGLVQHLLSLLDYNYDSPSTLPIPKELQPAIAEFFKKMLPIMLFEQMGDVILPLLEKSLLHKQVESLPQGELIKKGSQLFAQDFVQHFPKWVDDNIEKLKQDSQFRMLDPIKDDMTRHLREFLCQKETAYQPIWLMIQSYVESILLKMSVQLYIMSQQSTHPIRDLIPRIKDKLQALEQEENPSEIQEQVEQVSSLKPIDEARKEIFIELTDEVLEYLGVYKAQDLFGIPAALQKSLFVEIKQKLGQGLLALYKISRITHKVQRQASFKTPAASSSSPISKIAAAAQALTYYGLEKVTDNLTSRVNGGQMQGIVQIYSPVSSWLSKQKGKYRTAEVLSQVLDEQIPTPLLENLFNVLDHAQNYKQKISSWLTPILTEQVVNVLTPLLEKEEEGQAAFDQGFLLALLPVLTSHLKHLNEASTKPGGLNVANFLEAAQGNLHVAVNLCENREEQEVARQNHFYQQQTDLIFQLIFPKGPEDLAKILDLQLTKEQLDAIWRVSKETVAKQLSKVFYSIFKKESIMKMLSQLFEIMIENLDQPIQMGSFTLGEEEDRGYELDNLIRECLVEAAKLFDLPIDAIQQLPDYVKKIGRINNLEKTISTAIGSVIRKHFNGQFLAETLEKNLPKLAEKQHVKTPNKPQESPDERLRKLQKKAAEKSLHYVIRFMGAYLKRTTNIFTHPVLQRMHEAVASICSFVFTKIILNIFRLFGIESLIINQIEAIIRHRSDKLLMLFSEPALHENFVFSGTETFEKILIEEQDDSII